MIKTKAIKSLIATVIAANLCGCSGFFDKDNTPTPSPLVSFTSEAQPQLLWYANANAGMGNDYLKYVPAVTSHSIITVGRKGTIASTDKATGKTLWTTSIRSALTAGPAADDSSVFIGTRNGQIVALSQDNGAVRWASGLSSEVLAPPAVKNNVVVVKTIDGQLTGLNAQSGKVLWHYQQTEPALILRGGSAPQMTGNSTVVGFANGNLAKLSLREGSLQWQQTIAIPQGSFAIERMVDIDADPYISKNEVHVATYQGHIANLTLSTGQELWSHDISSFTGLTADGSKVYVSDATGYVWAFENATGTVDWRQLKLLARNITGPAMLANSIVVGDEQGYLHWLSKQDGHFIARTRVNHSGILATPVAENNIIYVLTKDGHLAAYRLA